MSQILMLIPARGGSRGVPRKNLVPLEGRPLIERAIAVCKGCRTPARIVVSSEDREIIEVARRAGAEVPFVRPAELARDETPLVPVVAHALDELSASGYRPEVLVLIQANSPFTRSSDIDRAVGLLLHNDIDVVYTVCPIAHPPHWAQVLDETGEPRLLLGEEDLPGTARRQDLPTVYRPTGNFSVMRTEHFRSCGLDAPARFFLPKPGQRSRAIVLDEVTSVDIDSIIDLALARAIVDYELRGNEASGAWKRLLGRGTP